MQNQPEPSLKMRRLNNSLMDFSEDVIDESALSRNFRRQETFGELKNLQLFSPRPRQQLRDARPPVMAADLLALGWTPPSAPSDANESPTRAKGESPVGTKDGKDETTQASQSPNVDANKVRSELVSTITERIQSKMYRQADAPSDDEETDGSKPSEDCKVKRRPAGAPKKDVSKTKGAASPKTGGSNNEKKADKNKLSFL